MTENSSLLTTSPIEQETMTRISVEPEHYLIRRLSWDDTSRQDAYQRLRADIFVKQFQWKIPLDEFGRERDRYDMQHMPHVSSHCVYGIQKKEEVEHEILLGGIRVFQLETWADSMVAQDFYQTGMVPLEVLQILEKQYDVSRSLELNRICVKREKRKNSTPQSQVFASEKPSFNLAFARDFTYAAAYKAAEETGRHLALGIAHASYLRLMMQGRFVLKVLHAHNLHDKGHGYAVILIDLPATVRAIRAAGGGDCADRMLALCENKRAFESITYSI